MVIVVVLLLIVALFFVLRRSSRIEPFQSYVKIVTSAPSDEEVTARPLEVSTAVPFVPGITGAELAYADFTAPRLGDAFVPMDTSTF